MKKKIVAFDFDGVLANTIEYCYDLHKENNEYLTKDEFKTFSEVNFFEGMGKAIREKNHIIPPDFFSHYNEYLQTISIHEVIRTVIEKISNTYFLAVISSTDDASIENFLKKEKILDCFSDICGMHIHTSKIFKITGLLKKYNVEPKDMVYITDTLGDIREAKECSVKTIGVLWGQHEQSTLKKGAPDEIIETPFELMEAIERVFK